MKLLFCRRCGDLFNLRYEAKSCECGEVWGGDKKDEGDRAFIEGSEAILFTVSNWEVKHLSKGWLEKASLYLYPINNGKIEVLP